MKTLPDKLKSNEHASLNKKDITIFNSHTGRKKTYKLPKWLIDEIDFEREMAKEGGRFQTINAIRKALEIR